MFSEEGHIAMSPQREKVFREGFDRQWGEASRRPTYPWSFQDPASAWNSAENPTEPHGAGTDTILYVKLH